MDADLDKICNLVGAPVMYNAVRLFLEALMTEPTSIPFTKYLVLCGGNLANIHLVCDYLWPLPPGWVRPST